jgi:hypothetical protein
MRARSEKRVTAEIPSGFLASRDGKLLRRLALAAVSALFVLVGPGAAAATPILLIDGSGKLTGAQHIVIGTTLYDVTFVDTTCAATFGGCTTSSVFDFVTPTAANDAANALLNQVFGSGDAYDTNPALTFGCTSSPSCQMWIPYQYNPTLGTFSASLATNRSGSLLDFVGGGNSTPSVNFGTNTAVVFADFSASVTSVPDRSSSLVLLGFGIIAIAAVQAMTRES